MATRQFQTMDRPKICQSFSIQSIIYTVQPTHHCHVKEISNSHLSVCPVCLSVPLFRMVQSWEPRVTKVFAAYVQSCHALDTKKLLWTHPRSLKVSKLPMRAPTATSSQHKAQLLKDFGQLMPFLDTKQPTLLYRTFCLLNAGLLPTISQLTFLLSLDDHVSLAELHLCNITPNYEKQNSKN